MSFSEAFTDTNGTSLPSHNGDYTDRLSGWQIQSNRGRAPSGSFGYVTYDGNVDGAALNDDQSIAAEFYSDDSNGSQTSGIVARGSSDTGYFLNSNINGFVELYRSDSFASETLTLLSDAGAISSGDTLDLQCVGSDITVLLNGSTSGAPAAASDANYGSGVCGYAAYNGGTSAEIDNVVISNIVSATRDQQGFRWYNDDGSESAMSAAAAEDTNLSAALGTNHILRVQLDATGDPDSTAYKLKYQKNGAGGYADVAVGASALFDLQLAGTDTTQDGDNTTTATLAVQFPAYADGDLVVILINMWDNGAAKTVTWPNGPNGETITSLTNGYGPGTPSGDNCYLSIGYFIGNGSAATQNVNITASATTRWAGGSIVVPAGEFDATTPVSSATGSANSTADTTSPNFTGFSANSGDTDGRLIAFVGVDQDPITGTPSGWTQLENLDQGRASIELAIRDAKVTSSESISSASWTIAGDSWSVFAFIIRPATITPEIYVSPSSNIAAGGVATTARLTAPTGKGGDFTTGRLWDDENGSDAIDIASDFYTELAWCLNTQGASASDYFDFRVYDGDTALDTYTVTPRWTIAASGPEDLTPTSATFTTTFQNAGLNAQRDLDAQSASYSYTPTNVNLDLTRYLSGTSQTYSWVPTSTDLVASRVLTGQSVAFTWTPTTTDLIKTLTLTAQSASFIVSATNVDLVASSLVTALSASYLWSPTNVDLIKSLLLSGQSAVYSVSATTVNLALTRDIGAQSAVYSWTPTNVSLDLTRYLSATAASYGYTPTNVDLVASRDLAGLSASYSWTPTNADLIAARVLAAQSQVYSWTGTTTDLTHNTGTDDLTALTAAFTVTPTNVDLITSRLLSGQSATYAVTPTNVSLALTRQVGATSAAYAWNPTNVSLVASRVLTANSASYLVNATNAGLNYATLLGATSASFSYTPTNVSLVASRILAGLTASYVWTPATTTLTYSAAVDFPDIDNPPSFQSGTLRYTHESQSERFSYVSQTPRYTYESN